MKITALYYCAALGLLLIGGLYLADASQPDLSELTSGEKLVALGRLTHLKASVEQGEELSGGAATVRDTGFKAFGRSMPNLKPFSDKWPHFRMGKQVFDQDWTAVQNSPLGPHYSSIGCEGCHDKDGRGRPPALDEMPESMVIQISVRGENGEQKPHPEYGPQLDYYTMTEGEKAEGRFNVKYDEIEGSFADGERFTLLSPRYEFSNLIHGSFGSDALFSARVAPVVFGLGLLEAIPEQDILALADPDDHNGDSISGRPNYVYGIASGKRELGRFGWKANQPAVAQQVARALYTDMGITSPYYPEDQSLVRHASNSAQLIEIDPLDFDRLLFYMKLLAVPRRRQWNTPEALHGKAVFNAAGCAGCHVPSFTTGVMPSYPEISNQVIRPYTDLLLHDMGEGLSDNRPDGLATGREWRTPPLWGIGLVHLVNKHTRFLHDGRARNLEEAILWHGGEAAKSQNFYRSLNREDRAALLKFLESL